MPIPKMTKRSNSGRGLKAKAHMTKEGDTLTLTFDSGETLTFHRDDKTTEEKNIFCDIFDTEINNAHVFASVSKDRSKLFYVRPLVGSFFVRVEGFAHPEGQPPSAKHYEGIATDRNGKPFKYSYDGFTVLMKVLNGEWKGTTLTAMLRYYFHDAGDGQTTGIRTEGKYSQQLAQFLEFAGIDFDNDTIPLSENVLPWLERTLVDREKPFMIVLNNGFVDAFAPAPEIMVTEL